MPAKWKTLNEEEKRALLHGGRVVRGPHVFKNMILHWPYCENCGLALLKNEATRKAAKQRCEWIDD